MTNRNMIFLSLTTRCNIRCEKCWRFDVFGAGKDAQPEVLNRFKELFSNYKGKVIIGSGENLISKGLNDYIEWSVKNNIQTTILTNGLKFDKFIDKPNFFSENITWGLTMDGFYNNELDTLQIGMDIEKVKNNIIQIKDKYPKASFYLNITHTKNNLNSTYKLIEFANQLNIKQIYITQLKLFEGLDDSVTKHQVNDFKSKEFLEIMDNAEKLAKEYKINFYAPLESKSRNCFDNTKSLSPIIHGNGNIMFCYGRDGSTLGNIQNKKDESVWKDHFDKLTNSQEERDKWCKECNVSETSERGYYYIPGQKGKNG